MKNFKRLVLMLVMALSMCMMTACTDESIAAWPGEESAPNQLVHAGEWWYAAIGNYGSPNASLAVGESPETMKLVYESKGNIWGELTAAADHAVWLELLGDDLRWLLYSREADETIVVYEERFGDVRPCLSVAVDEAAMYYVRTDYSAGSAEVIRRAHADGAETVLFAPGCPVSALRLRQGELIIACDAADGWQLLRIDAEDGSAVAMKQLPENVEMVYCVDYDPATLGYAVYYYDDAGKEHAGLYAYGELHSIYTFGEHSYAYHDRLELVDGHLMWVVKDEVSGMVADHFRMIDVDLVESNHTEHERSFSYCMDGDTLLLLTIDIDKEQIVLEKAR